MSDSIIFDTNLWIYFISKEPFIKSEIIQELIDNKYGSIVVSTQILGELYNALTKKNYLSQDKSEHVIKDLVSSFPIIGIDSVTVLKAIDQ